MTYEIWLLGYNEDDTANDFEELIATFPDDKIATWFFMHFDFSYDISKTPLARALLEQVREEPDGSGTCVDVIAEREI